MTVLPAGGPYFDDLEVGDEIRSAPALTLTDGAAAAHRAILGDRLRLPLDAELSGRVLGGPLAHPSLVCDVSIGQSTLVTQRVVANLFYRGLALRRAPLIGDTLHTTTSVVALKQNTLRPDRPPTGLAVLRIVTVDQRDRAVLDYHRCAMLPLREAVETGRTADLDAIPAALDAATLADAVAGWRLEELRAVSGGPLVGELAAGARWEGIGGAVVSSAPELARLTLNIAVAHHDATRTGRRLVYGGHTIGIAAGHIAIALPDLATIVAWERCDHLAPVYEGDTLFTDVELERVDPDSGLVWVRARVRADRDGAEPSDVLDWRLVAIHP
ncbi:MaoC family dehydratase [Conexibacter arvalis]|uniref:Acyl dehydratase n=1 Tax=Conexibacter arvalis TaxID=912552 RepID=A0A840ILK1_9ACTN|nr:MaoC family dehydratase [Conexibacter arvalis]MBB4665225.1 acyl dehydratase [Conexibacter arvalis]